MGIRFFNRLRYTGSSSSNLNLSQYLPNTLDIKHPRNRYLLQAPRNTLFQVDTPPFRIHHLVNDDLSKLGNQAARGKRSDDECLSRNTLCIITQQMTGDGLQAKLQILKRESMSTIATHTNVYRCESEPTAHLCKWGAISCGIVVNIPQTLHHRLAYLVQRLCRAGVHQGAHSHPVGCIPSRCC